MPIDASIPLQARMPQFDDPLAVQTKRLQLSDLMGRQQAQQAQIAATQRAQQEQQTLADLYRESAGDPAKVRQLLAERGLGSRIPGFDKEQAEIGKTMGEAEGVKLKNAKTKIEATGAAISSLLAGQNVTPEAVIGTLQSLVQRGFMEPAEGARLARSLPPDPAALRRVLLQAGLEVMDASKRIDLLLPKSEIRNMGGSDQQFSTDQLTGQVTQGQTFGKTATPDAVMSDARQRSEGAANRGVQVRGQDMTAKTAAAGRDAASAKVDGKPLAAAAAKQITEARDNAATIERLATAFKPEYGGKGVLGIGADTQMAASGNLGVDKDAVEWWKNYRKDAELVERHALFGAALTPTEQASWRSADIAPGMDAKVIAKNLATRTALAKRVLSNTRQDLVDAGHNEQRVGAIADRGAAVPDDIAAILKKHGGK